MHSQTVSRMEPVSKSEVGEVVGPFESKFGWHPFLIEKRSGVDSVTDKKDQ